MKNKIFLALLFLAALPKVSLIFASESPWDCQEENWTAEPRMEEGLYKSELESRCVFEPSGGKNFADLREKLQEYLISKREVHAGPILGQWNGIPSWTYDTTVTPPGEASLRIRESVVLATDGLGRFWYGTQSKEIQGSGLSSYLKNVSFSLELKRTPGSPRIAVVMRNGIQVERPWYALGPIFFLITKGKAKEKFAVARELLLTEVFKRL